MSILRIMEIWESKYRLTARIFSILDAYRRSLIKLGEVGSLVSD